MTDLTALRNVLREAEVSLAATCREAEAKQAAFLAAPEMDLAKEARNAQERFYAAVMRRDRARAAVAAAEREAAA